MKTRTLWLVGLLFVQSLGAASFKISELPEATTAVATNLAVIVSSTGETSKIAVGNLLTSQYGLNRSFNANDLQYTNIVLGGLAAGENDIYTVPAGKRAFMESFGLGVGTTNSASVTYKFGYKTNSTYTAFAINTVTTNVMSGTGQTFVWEPAETISLNCSLSGVNVWATLVLIDSDLPIKTFRFTGFAAGENTVYTVPAGKQAYRMTSLLPQAAGVTFNYLNFSGGTRTINTFAVPSGSSISITNRMLWGPVSDGAAKIFTVGIMQAGDFIVMDSDANTAGQIAWGTVLEIP